MRLRLFLFLSLLGGALQAADFKGDVLPIMRQHCYKCHGNGKTKALFRMKKKIHRVPLEKLSEESRAKVRAAVAGGKQGREQGAGSRRLFFLGEIGYRAPHEVMKERDGEVDLAVLRTIYHPFIDHFCTSRAQASDLES